MDNFIPFFLVDKKPVLWSGQRKSFSRDLRGHSQFLTSCLAFTFLLQMHQLTMTLVKWLTNPFSQQQHGLAPHPLHDFQPPFQKLSTTPSDSSKDCQHLPQPAFPHSSQGSFYILPLSDQSLLKNTVICFCCKFLVRSTRLAPTLVYQKPQNRISWFQPMSRLWKDFKNPISVHWGQLSNPNSLFL